MFFYPIWPSMSRAGRDQDKKYKYINVGFLFRPLIAGVCKSITENPYGDCGIRLKCTDPSHVKSFARHYKKKADSDFKQLKETDHVRSIDRRSHLHFPVVLALRQLPGSSDGSGAAAVVRVEAHLPVVAAEGGSWRLTVLVPHPVKHWENKYDVFYFTGCTNLLPVQSCSGCRKSYCYQPQKACQRILMRRNQPVG